MSLDSGRAKGLESIFLMEGSGLVVDLFFLDAEPTTLQTDSPADPVYGLKRVRRVR
jgi:hypothetical protein